MLRQLMLGLNGRPVLEEYEDGVIPAGYVRVKCDFGAPKHGTEIHMYDKNPFFNVYYDESTHIFRPREKPVENKGKEGLGNMWIGNIFEKSHSKTYPYTHREM